MGKLEQKRAKQFRRTQIQTAVLSTIKVAGILSAAAIAPGTLRYLGILDNKLKRAKSRSIRAAKQRLLEEGLICVNEGHYEVTKKGELLLSGIENESYYILKPKKWDTRWRVLIFDIPESKKVIRDKLSRTLRSVGCLRIQDSVWVYPYDCEDLIALLKIDFKIGTNLIYMIVEYIENDHKLRMHFGLPKSIE